MFTKFIETHGSVEDKKQIPSTDLNHVKDHIPTELFEMLSEGTGSYMNGFLWIVNPIEYKDMVEEIYLPITRPAICFARDAFGSLFLWEDNSVIYVDVNLTRQEVVGRKINVFFDLKLTDAGFLEKKTAYTKFLKYNQSLGKLSENECYGYFPLLGMGGSDKIENLKKVKIREYLSIVAQSLGQIQ